MMVTAAVELHRALNGNTEFLEQVCGVLFNAARDIEANPEETTERKAWAVKVKTNRKAMAREMLADILENATIAADVTAATDADVAYQVATLIDTYAAKG
jgi:prophage DNA circulation protein